MRSGDNPQDAQLRMIRDGEAISLDGELSLKDSDEEDGEESQEPAESDEDEE